MYKVCVYVCGVGCVCVSVVLCVCCCVLCMNLAFPFFSSCLNASLLVPCHLSRDKQIYLKS
jgi:hypothetical protein